MKKILFLLMSLMSISVSAQKLEHGALIGGSIGFPMQDKGESVTPPFGSKAGTRSIDRWKYRISYAG